MMTLGKIKTIIKIYGKSGETCLNCGSTFRFTKVGGRGTTFCPKCQIKKGAPLNVAVTGKISSGKSLFTKILHDHGVDTLSSDEVVKELYKKEDVANLISKTLKITFPSPIVDKDILRKHLILNPKDKKKLEKVVHALVLKEIKNFLSTSKSQIRLVEVPLLFEAKMDVLFDTIVVIDIDEEKQDELLLQREGEKAIYLKEINKTNKIDENKNKASYLVKNDGNINKFKKDCLKVLSKLQDCLN